ncbi:MAG TPA: Crp/Fnr family transcriptional regulator [Caulobacteraceae bacterium]|nr:Crp/Fnr family transcriptional regulator [Caulobacteraceae bacterium]
MSQAIDLRAHRGVPNGAFDALGARLSALATLTAADRFLIASLAAQRQAQPAGAEICGDGRRMPRLMLSGWACRQRELPDGRRQIFEFILPGDLIWPGPRQRPLALAVTVALTSVATADARALAAVAAEPQHAGLMAAIETSAALEEIFLLDHLVRIGRQTAYERTGHLLLELHWRLGLAGLVRGSRFSMPLTQEILADALGLSVVHMNRTLQHLRREGLIRLQCGELELLDVAALARIADYTPPLLAPTKDGPAGMQRGAFPARMR